MEMTCVKSEAGIQTGGSIPRLTSVEEKLFRDKRYCFFPVGTEDNVCKGSYQKNIRIKHWCQITLLTKTEPEPQYGLAEFGSGPNAVKLYRGAERNSFF